MGRRGRSQDFRLPAGGEPSPRTSAAAVGTREIPRAFLLLGDVLQTGLFRVSDRFTGRWGSHAGESFTISASSPPDTGGSVYWHVDLAARTVALASGGGSSATTGALWQITGSACTWEQVIRGRLNLNVALRRRDLRYCDTGEAATVASTRISMLADLLGITSWRAAESASRREAVAAR